MFPSLSTRASHNLSTNLWFNKPQVVDSFLEREHELTLLEDEFYEKFVTRVRENTHNGREQPKDLLQVIFEAEMREEAAQGDFEEQDEEYEEGEEYEDEEESRTERRASTRRQLTYEDLEELADAEDLQSTNDSYRTQLRQQLQFDPVESFEMVDDPHPDHLI